MLIFAISTDDKEQKKSQKVVSELENIDDDCDQHNIAFVKISDLQEAKEYGIESLPTLVLFERKIPHIYDGESCEKFALKKHTRARDKKLKNILPVAIP